jgi:chromosome segregation ATPase
MDCIGLEKLELELREEIEEIKRSTNKQIIDLQDENTKASEQVKFLVEKLDASEKNNIELQDALSQMSADKAKVEVDTMDKINDLEEELRSLKEKYALLDQEFTEVQQSDRNNRYKLENLSAEFAKVSEEILAFQIQCEANRNFTEQLEVRLEEASQRVAQEKEELRQKEEEVNKLQAKGKTLGEIERRKSIKPVRPQARLAN